MGASLGVPRLQEEQDCHLVVLLNARLRAPLPPEMGLHSLVLFFITQKRDGECTKADPREAQHAAHMENTRKGVGRGRNGEGSPGYA